MALMCAAVVGIFQSLTSGNQGDVAVSAQISQIGDSLEIGDIVTYREVIVGEVRSFQIDGQGGASLELRLSGVAARSIPSSVTAIGVPADLFGQTAVMLDSGGRLSGRHLKAGDHISADRSPAAAGLQSALAEAYHLMATVHPAQLNGALSALNTALQGNGKTLGETIDAAALLVRQIQPVIPKLDQVIRQVATVSVALARNSPALLASLNNLLTPARAIVEHKDAITRLLSVATPATQRSAAFLHAVGANVVTIVTNWRPVLDAIAQNPRGLAGSITGFGSLAAAFKQCDP